MPYCAESKPYLDRFDKNISNHLLFIFFFTLSLLLENDSQAQQVNPSCLKCISGINLSPANKNLLTIHLFISINKIP